MLFPKVHNFVKVKQIFTKSLLSNKDYFNAKLQARFPADIKWHNSSDFNGVSAIYSSKEFVPLSFYPTNFDERCTQSSMWVAWIFFLIMGDEYVF